MGKVRQPLPYCISLKRPHVLTRGRFSPLALMLGGGGVESSLKSQPMYGNPSRGSQGKRHSGVEWPKTSVVVSPPNAEQSGCY